MQPSIYESIAAAAGEIRRQETATHRHTEDSSVFLEHAGTNDA